MCRRPSKPWVQSRRCRTRTPVKPWGRRSSVSANLDLVRSIYAAWQRGDSSRADWADQGIEVVAADGPQPGTHTGHAGMAAGWRGFLGAWRDYHVEADEFRELDSERVLVLMRHGGYGRASGLGDQEL